MVVDDRADLRRSLARIIEAQPSFRLVGMASDFESGLELAEREQPDVALVDYKMSGGGPRLTREISARCPKTSVVGLSAYADSAAVFAMLRAGAVSYLVKGEDVAEIVRTIERAKVGESSLSESITSDVLRELTNHLQERGDSDDVRRQRVIRVREAIKAGAIETVYQPIVKLASRETVGFEALSRFRLEPKQTPDEWFAEAKTVGLELELERATLNSALTGLERIPSDCFLSVNLGPAALLDESILVLLGARTPERIVLELTEHAAIDDYDRLRYALLDLRAQGLRLAIDDAGAGYASLRHVLSLAPDILKIDAGVTGQVEKDRGSQALTSALVSFATAMRQLVIAEGIEHDETIEALEAIGVQYGQGFLFGKPQRLPASWAKDSHDRAGKHGAEA
jgi:EAL domain-containing protein (putative c-di-GMP-specific phosphodiesterase class I)/ActR/RegA family two-component response regulator